MTPARLRSFGVAVWLVCAAWAAWSAERLPALAVDPSATTVSGVSSGGYMAVQLHVAHSTLVKGAGVIAAGPYYCAQDSAWTARYNCMHPGAWTPLPSVPVLVSATQTFAAAGQIDPPSNLRQARVWLLSGRKDETVLPAVVEALDLYYQHWVPSSQVVVLRDLPAGHAMITADYGSACAATTAPFLNDCDFDAAGALLQHLYGALEPPRSQQTGKLERFDQREFAAGTPYRISLDDDGYVYIPAACRAGGCRVHVALHGCDQGHEAVGDQFVRHAGYNRWADHNRIVVLYPQVIARYGWGPWPWPSSFVFNPAGCWDWWGYTGDNYATKSGAQIRAVKAMLDRLASPPPQQP